MLEVWMLRRICLMATLMFMTPAVAGDYGVQKHLGQRYGHVYAHRYYVRRGYVRPRGGGLFGCRHWSPSAFIGRVISGEIGRGSFRPPQRELEGC
jgi:hypothetical protein